MLGRPVLCSRHDVSKSNIASVKFPCGICMKGVRVNSILCLSCWNWVHKWCSGIKTSLRNCEKFICKTCSTTAGVVDPFRTCITIKRDEFEIFSEFCYLGDVIGQVWCWCCECSYWISLEGFSPTSNNTHKQRHIYCKPWKSI